MNSQNFKHLSFLFLLIAGLGDLGTTLYGISAGFQETRPFGIFCLMTTVIFGSAVWSFYKLPVFSTAPEKARRIVTACLVLFAFSPLAYNLGVLLGVWGGF
jgi:hypothetical protein